MAVPQLPLTVIYCDGLTEPSNPGGYGCWGWIAYAEGGASIGQGCGCLGQHSKMTNNIAEYQAVIEALRWCVKQGIEGVLMCSDSQLVIRQLEGSYACNKEHLRVRRDAALDLAAKVGVRWQWVPREDNEPADDLSRKAYAQANPGGRIRTRR